MQQTQPTIIEQLGYFRYEETDSTVVSIGDLKVSLGIERYLVGEALFNPQLVGLDAKGLHHQIIEAIEAATQDDNERTALYNNIYLIGGKLIL